MTQSNYYSHDTDFHYMSKSIFQQFEDCEAETLAELKGDWDPKKFQQPSSTPDPLIFGNFIHSYFQSKEAHEAFLKEPDTVKEIYKHNSKGKPTSKLKAAYTENGLAQHMIDKISLNPKFVDAYRPGDPEGKEVIVTGKIDGYWWKGKIDSLDLDDGFFCDLKTTKDIHAAQWIKDGDRKIKTNFIEAYGYFMQMAVYQELIRQTFGKTCVPLMFVVSKQRIPELANVIFDQRELPDTIDVKYLMDSEIDKIKQLQPHFWRVMNGEEKPRRCGHCDYCRYTNTNPDWILPTEIKTY